MARRLMGMVVLLVLGSPALTAEDAAARAGRCAAIADSLERLMCYDGIFRHPGQGSAAAAPSAARATAPLPAPVAAPAPVTAPPPAAPAMPASVAAADAGNAAASAVAGFGAEQIRRSSREQEVEVPRTLVAQVTQVHETRPNVYRMTLDNGQVWQQMDMDSRFDVRAGDTVEINRGRMGGYRMARQSRGGSGWVRVNRVK
jgi:hypothetical protein